MNPHRTALALALVSTFIAGAARAGRDEPLIQQTRRNQLMHDARIKKREQEREREQEQEQARQRQAAAAAPAPAPGAPRR